MDSDPSLGFSLPQIDLDKNAYSRLQGVLGGPLDDRFFSCCLGIFGISYTSSTICVFVVKLEFG